MNCKPGDLAIVVKSIVPTNLGKIVQVVKPYVIGDSHIVHIDSEQVLWLCCTTGSPLSWASVLGVEVERAVAGPIPDQCLRPLRLDDEPAMDLHHDAAPVAA